jgi:hypothetical protein
MKRGYTIIAFGVLLIILSLFNISLNIDSKGHYFGNGVMCGIGLSLIIFQVKQLKKNNNKKKE